MKVQITSMIEISTIEQIDEVCRVERITRSEFVRNAVENSLNKGE